MSTRGHLGGLSAATPQAVRVLDGAGCDVVLVETVGVGQAEVEVAALADTTLVLLAPGMGDAIQAVKAGILEIADVFVVNKADRDGADATVPRHPGHDRARRARRRASGGRRSCAPSPPAARASTTSSTAIDKHRDVAGRARRAAPPPRGAGRRRDRGDRARRAARPDRIAARRRRSCRRWPRAWPTGTLDPYAAADELLAQLDRARADPVVRRDGPLRPRIAAPIAGLRRSYGSGTRAHRRPIAAVVGSGARPEVRLSPRADETTARQRDH